MKQTNSLQKRLLSALLALVCVLGLLPASASAFAATLLHFRHLLEEHGISIQSLLYSRLT